MRTFEISRRPVTLIKVNPRNEHHGEDEVLRVDLDFGMTISPEDLARFATSDTAAFWSEQYRTLLYDTERNTFAGHQLSALSFNRYFEHHGLLMQIPDKRKPLEFADIKLTKFRALLSNDGQTMTLRFQAQLDPGEDVDSLVHAMGQTVTITTTPPAQMDVEDVSDPAEEPAEEEEGS